MRPGPTGRIERSTETRTEQAMNAPGKIAVARATARVGRLELPVRAGVIPLALVARELETEPRAPAHVPVSAYALDYRRDGG